MNPRNKKLIFCFFLVFFPILLCLFYFFHFSNTVLSEHDAFTIAYSNYDQNLTINYAQEQNKPFFIISLAEQGSVIDEVQQWVKDNNIEKLNIAGPRESNSPGIYEQSCGLFRELFPALKLYTKMSC